MPPALPVELLLAPLELVPVPAAATAALQEVLLLADEPAGEDPAEAEPAAAVLLAEATPAIAALISSAVASSTIRFCVKAQLEDISSDTYERVAGIDLPNRVVCIVTSVAFRGRVADLAWRKGTTLQCILSITTDRSNLLSKSKDNGLVRASGAIRSRILMLLNSCDLGIDGLNGCTRVGLESNRASVALEGAIDKSSCHARHIIGGLGVSECLVGGGLLETFGVGDLAGACSSSLSTSAMLDYK